MLKSMAIVCIVGLFLAWGMRRLHLPRLLGYLATGLLLGSFFPHWLDPTFLDLSPVLRQMALIIILIRAGLNMDISELKRIGRPAILMSFVPACFEITATVLLAPQLLPISYAEAALMGAVLAAVSPAVIVPQMIELQNQKYGIKKGVPQLIMAGASVDDIFVIVLFTSFLTLSETGTITLQTIGTMGFNTLLSILFGIALGCAIGWLLAVLFDKMDTDTTFKTIATFCVAMFLVYLEGALEGLVPLSGLLGVIAMAVVILAKEHFSANEMAKQFQSIWLFAEILLFALVALAVDIKQALSFGFMPIVLLFCVLAVRLLGVYVCLLGTPFNSKEKVFCMIAYTPKATVQAAIGAIPLGLGLPAGNQILTVAVLSILITAPLGAVGLEKSYRKLLTQN